MKLVKFHQFINSTLTHTLCTYKLRDYDFNPPIYLKL